MCILLKQIYQIICMSMSSCIIYLVCPLQVFSKLKEGRFPGEIELKDLVGKRLVNSRVADMWT